MNVRNAALLLVSLFATASSVEEMSSVRVVESALPVERDDPANATLPFVKVMTVEESDWVQPFELTAVVTYDETRTHRVASPFSGSVVRVFAKIGDTVKHLQPLLELTSPEVPAVQSRTIRARQDLSLTNWSLQRTHWLMPEGAVSEKDYEPVEADSRKAQVDMAQAVSKLAALSILHSKPTNRFVLKAFSDGTVVDQRVVVGQQLHAHAAEPLITISDLSTLWVIADVREEHISIVNKGAKVAVEVAAYAGEHFASTVDYISDIFDPVSRTLKLRCRVSNSDSRLKPGMSARVVLDTTTTMPACKQHQDTKKWRHERCGSF